jgi:hypothetical protein
MEVVAIRGSLDRVADRPRRLAAHGLLDLMRMSSTSAIARSSSTEPSKYEPSASAGPPVYGSAGWIIVASAERRDSAMCAQTGQPPIEQYSDSIGRRDRSFERARFCRDAARRNDLAREPRRPPEIHRRPGRPAAAARKSVRRHPIRIRTQTAEVGWRSSSRCSRSSAECNRGDGGHRRRSSPGRGAAGWRRLPRRPGDGYASIKRAR